MIEFDSEAKALYIRLKECKVAETIEYPEAKEAFLDFDEQKQLIGIEILDPFNIDILSILSKLSTYYAISDLDVDEIKLASMYAEFADEDRELAESGMIDYDDGLAKEDTDFSLGL